VSELTSTNAFRRNLHQLAASVVGPPLFSPWILQCTAQCCYDAQMIADPLLWNVDVRFAPRADVRGCTKKHS
jgi:hypothetical protein